MYTLSELMATHKSSWGRAAEAIAYALVFLTPLFFLSVNHWISNASILACVFILIAYSSSRMGGIPWKSPAVIGVCVLSTIYTSAIVVSQIGRGIFVYREFLDQTRWMVALPFFIYIYTRKIDYARALDWIAPIAVIFSWISSTFLIPSGAWGDRHTISFIDPLAYGFLNLSVALVCLASFFFDVSRKNTSLNTWFKLIGFFVGVYLSIRTGSRSGWLAFPVVIFLLFSILYRVNSFKALTYLLAIAGASLFVYYLSPTVHTRIDVLVQEIWEYPWLGGVAPDTSVGLRLTFYRLGFYYFSQSPLWGWGERGYAAIKDAPELLTFSSQFAREFAFSALFHSEWTTQMVRFGVLGLFGVVWVFFFPMTYFYRILKRGDFFIKIASVGLSYMTCLLVASVGDEVFNSKGMITFSSIIIIGLIATAAAKIPKEPDRALSEY